jgi:hypothetical protein
MPHWLGTTGQIVGSGTGQWVACFGHCVGWIGQRVSLPGAAHWVGLWVPEHAVGTVAHWVVSGVHSVTVSGQVVRLTGHWVTISGQVVVVTGHWVGTLAGHWVGISGQVVWLTGHSVGTGGEHSVADSGQVV